MVQTVQEMLAVASQCGPKISPAEAQRLIGERDALLVDVRDGMELAATGKLANALHVSRGTLEFKADPTLPGYEPQLRRDRPVILYCASGGRSCLAAKTLHDLGFEEVYNLGGFSDAAAAGFPTQSA